MKLFDAHVWWRRGESLPLRCTQNEANININKQKRETYFRKKTTDKNKREGIEKEQEKDRKIKKRKKDRLRKIKERGRIEKGQDKD